ncbi:MAG: formyltransferase family protein [Nanoarchaeota archaeon]
MTGNIRLAYMASGSGSSVENLVTRIRDDRLTGYESAAIICNKAQAGIYERANRLRVPIHHASRGEDQLSILLESRADLVLCLGYLKKVDDVLLDHFKDKVLNIHPTLLPKHGGKGMYGLTTHMSVLQSGDAYTGPTVHMLNTEYDEGRMLRQVVVPVPAHLIGNPSEEHAKELQQYVLYEEYRIMTEVLEQIRDGRLKIGLSLD